MRGLKVGKAAVGAFALALGSFATAAPASVKPGGPPIPPPIIIVPAHPGVRPPPNFDAMIAFVNKLFPPQPDPDPARLALARTSAAAMWPDGAYGRMMSGFMGNMFERVLAMKASEMPGPMATPKPRALSSKQDLSIHDQAVAKDPCFDQRTAAIRSVVTDELGKFSVIVDPRIREGMARAMARRLDARQLTDVDRFFATPSGRAFAGQYMQLWLDPDTMRSLFTSMPETMKLMPEMSQKMKAASDRFPKPVPAPPVKPPVLRPKP